MQETVTAQEPEPVQEPDAETGHEEAMAVCEEEQKKTDETKEMTKEIKNLMRDNPSISAGEIAAVLNISAESVRYRIKKMKQSGEITRKGSTKAGIWEVIS